MSKLLCKYHVFVVDDEPIIAATLAMILRGQGFDARSFTEPFEVLQAVVSYPPDLLITDLMLPLLSGIELAILVREHCPHCKVLLFSGYVAASDLNEAALAKGQVFEFLSKPAHPRDVLKKVCEMMEGIPRRSLVHEFKRGCKAARGLAHEPVK